jgi:hypothetical protein
MSTAASIDLVRSTMRYPPEPICEGLGPSAAQVRRTDETQSRPPGFPMTPPTGAARRPRFSVPSGKHGDSGGLAGGAQAAGGQGPGMGDPEARVTLMNAMSATGTPVRSTAAVADTRDTARAFLEDLRQPTIATGSRGHRDPDRVRTRHQRPAPRRGHLDTGTDGPPVPRRGDRPRSRLAGAAHAHA